MFSNELSIRGFWEGIKPATSFSIDNEEFAPDYRDPVAEFRDAMRNAGCLPADGVIRANDTLHRYQIDGENPGKKSGAYRLKVEPDGFAYGWFQDWRKGEPHSWCNKAAAEYTSHDRARIEQARAQAEREREQAAEHAAEKAAERWNKASTDGASPYLERKQVNANGVRFQGAGILVPVTDGDKIMSLQAIAPDGEKRFMPGGRTGGGYFLIKGDTATIAIAEGFATAASVHEATGWTSVVAFNANNLPKVARAIRARFPGAEIVIAGDADKAGRTKGDEAASAARGRAVYPPSGDWNDLHCRDGLTAVRDALRASLGPWRSAAEFEGKEEKKQEWIVKDFVPRGEVTLLAGDGGLNKSTVMLYLCAAVVEAQTTYPKTWMGQPVSPGQALFFSCEDPEPVIQRRLKRYCAEEGCRLSDLANLEWRSVIEEDTELAVPDPKTRKMTPTALYHALRTRIEETRPALVVIENASDVFAGNENDRLEVRAFVRLLKIIAIRNNCAIVLLAHPSKNREYSYSGSTAWQGAVRALLTMKKPEGNNDDQGDPDGRILRAEKIQEGTPGRFIKLRNHGGHVAYDDQGVSMKPAEQTAFAEGVFLKLLDEYNETGRYQSNARVCNTFAKDEGNEGVQKRAFERARDALFRKGVIELREEGPKSRRVAYIHRKEQAEA